MPRIFSRFISSQSRSSRYATVISFLIIHLLLLVLVCYLRWDHSGRSANTMQLYYRYSLNLRQGQMPYRDFPFEYPPLALLPIALPQFMKLDRPMTLGEYIWAFMLGNALINALLGLTVVRMASFFQPWNRCLKALTVYSLVSIISAPILLGRYDLFPTLLVGVSVAAAIGGHSMRSGIWLGLAVAAKLYPIVLLPILSIYYLVSRNYKSLLKVFVGVTVAICLTLLPFLSIGTGQLLYFLEYHQVRGLQIESIPAGIVLLGHLLGATSATVVSNFGAAHLISPAADIILKWLPILSALAFTLLAINCLSCFRHEFRQRHLITNESLLAFLMSALLTFIVTGKVFSPQYVGWLLPFAPFLSMRQIILLILVFLMTIVVYPFNYRNLQQMQTLPILFLNVRNFMVMVLLVWVVAERLTVAKTPVILTQVEQSEVGGGLPDEK